MAKNRNKKQNTVNNAKSNAVNNGLESSLGLPCDERPNPIYDAAGHNITPYYITFWFPYLTNAYKSIGFVQSAINQIVDDAFRNEGAIIDAATLETDELERLRRDFYEYDVEDIKDAIRWGQLYGGGCIVANTDQNPTLPLDEKQLQGRRLKFLASDRWHCSPADGVNIHVAKEFYLTDVVNNFKNPLQVIDSSRVKCFTGLPTPIYIRNIMSGWGLSIFEAILKPLQQYLKAMNVALELLDEAKIDVIKIFDLASVLLSDDGEQKIRKRIDIVTKNKNYKSSIAMDSQDDYQQKQISFSGLPEMIVQIQFLVCAALKRPYSKLFGKGSSGFSSGDDDLENYNTIVDSEIRTPATQLVKWAVGLRCAQLYGRIPPDLKITWKPLRVMSEKDMSEINSRKLADYLQLVDRQIMTKKQVAQKLTEENIVLFSEEEIAAIDDEFEPENYNNVEDLLID